MGWGALPELAQFLCRIMYIMLNSGNTHTNTCSLSVHEPKTVAIFNLKL